MSKPNRNAKPTMVSLFPKQVEMIKHFIEIKGGGSASEVVRQAIVFYFDKTFPDYIWKLEDQQLSEDQLKKREGRRAEESFKAITDKDFALNTLKAIVAPGAGGIEYAIFHRPLGNTAWVLPVAGLKEWAAHPKHQLDAEESIAKSEHDPMTKDFFRLAGYRSMLEEFGIVL